MEKPESFKEKAVLVVETMRREKRIYKNYVSREATSMGSWIVQEMKNASQTDIDALIELCKPEIPREYPYMAVWWYSVFIKMKKDKAIFWEWLCYIRENRNAFSKNTQDFLYYQLAYLYDSNAALYDDKIKMGLWGFFLEIVEEFVADCTVPLTEIPERERDNGLVLVIMTQFVEYGHAPTVTALDRCKILQEKMGQRVLVINTAEAANRVGRVPIVSEVIGNNENLEEKETVSWKGTSIPYYQCKSIMPDVDIMNQLLEQVRSLAPKCVILIGGSSILGNLIDRIIPALTISTGFSDLAITGTRYQAIGRTLTKEDEEKLNILGYDKSHVIESRFTFDIKPQQEKVSREEILHIPENAFVMAVVSTRMDAEVTDEFLQMLEETLDEGEYLVFAGDFPTYEKRMKAFPILREKSMSLGFCDDVLSRLELCDLYLNPRRKGGGSSVVEAMYLGKPVVSIAYGDVALNAGEEFCVENYQEMAEEISQYCHDRSYYEVMSEKAKKRAEVLLDTESAFREIMEEYDRREVERVKYGRG